MVMKKNLELTRSRPLARSLGRGPGGLRPALAGQIPFAVSQTAQVRSQEPKHFMLKMAASRHPVAIRGANFPFSSKTEVVLCEPILTYSHLFEPIGANFDPLNFFAGWLRHGPVLKKESGAFGAHACVTSPCLNLRPLALSAGSMLAIREVRAGHGQSRQITPSHAVFRKKDCLFFFRGGAYVLPSHPQFSHFDYEYEEDDEDDLVARRPVDIAGVGDMIT